MQLQKTLAWRNLFIFKAPLLCANHFFLINHTRKLFWHANLNGPQRKNFGLIIIQLSEVDIHPSSELFVLIQMSSLFIHVTNFKITITNLNSKLCIYCLKSWHFLNNQWVSSFLEETSSLPSHTIWEWRTEIRKFDLVYRITRPFTKPKLRFTMQGP